MMDAWHGFWFAPGNVAQLGQVRVGFFCLLFMCSLASAAPKWAEVCTAAPHFWRPVSLFRLLPRAPGSPAFSVYVRRGMWVWTASIVLAALGFAFPFGSLAAAVFTFLLFGLENQFGKIHHQFNLMPLIALTLSVAPSDRYCVWTVVELPDSSSGLFWPIQLIRTLISFTWLAAGISKIRKGGLRWMVGDNLSNLLRLHVMDYYFKPPGLPGFSQWMARRTVLCRLAAVGTVVFEVAFPLALLDGAPALVFPLMGVVLLLGFAAAQGPFFYPLALVSLLAWAPVVSF